MKNISRRDFVKNSLASGTLLAATPLSASEQRHAIDPLIGYDATGMADLVKTGQVSASELAEMVIRRIEVMNPIVNCVATPAFDRALDRADSISTDTPFAGVPILAKDMIDIAGIRRSDGSRLWATNVPGKSPDYIEALEKSGLNIIGTTVVPEFANGLGSELYGRPRNPWNLDYSCALSSSGAACAVASGVLPLVHGTDGGGSNRLPASACNLIGFKPSRGRMYSGERGGGHDVFKTNGPISRTVRDAVAMMRACEDPGNPFGLIGDVTGPAERRFRIAYARSGTQPEGSVVASVLEAQDKVAQLLIDLGHEVVEVEHPVDREEYNQMFRWAFLPKFAPLLKIAMDISGRGALDTGLLTHWTATSMVEGQSFSAEQNATGLAYFERLADAFAATFEDFDVMFSATTPFETLRGDAIRTADDFLDKSHILETVLSLTSPVNAIGDCAIGLPLSFSNATGMPVGSMFHAPTGKDRMLFEIAFELERAVAWHEKWAPVSLKHIPT